jgi:hypothetical protein
VGIAGPAARGKGRPGRATANRVCGIERHTRAGATVALSSLLPELADEAGGLDEGAPLVRAAEAALQGQPTAVADPLQGGEARAEVQMASPRLIPIAVGLQIGEALVERVPGSGRLAVKPGVQRGRWGGSGERESCRMDH